MSSGISFRELPPPSLEEIKKICEHYQTKCAGTYKSLASRYVYQMASEIDHLVDALKEGGYVTTEQGSLSTLDDRDFKSFSVEVHDNPRSRKKKKISSTIDNSRTSSSRSRRRDHTNDRRNHAASSAEHQSSSTAAADIHHGSSRPRTACTANIRKPSHSSYRRTVREFPFDCIDELSIDSPPRKARHHSSSSRYHKHERRLHNNSSLARLNLEDQNDEVLRWLKEEMKRSQSLINRSKQMHDAELDSAKKEVEKVKKAAKLLIKAVHKKEKHKVAKSEANAESERRQRRKSQKLIESLIQSHSAQIGQLKKGLRHHHGVGSSRGVDELREQMGRFYPWGELQDDTTDVSFTLSDASDMTSVLDSLAEEAFSRSAASHC